MSNNIPIEATPLPGIGTQYTLKTHGGRALSIVAARDGRRSLAIFDIDDPGACGPGVRLTQAQAQAQANALAELLTED